MSEPLFQSVWVRLKFASTHIIRFSSSSLFATLKKKNTVQLWLRFDKNGVKPVYKTPVRFDFLFFFLYRFIKSLLCSWEYVEAYTELAGPIFATLRRGNTERMSQR